MKIAPHGVTKSIAALTLGIILTSVGSLVAGEFNPDINIGDPAPVYRELPGTDGKQHSSSDLKDKRVVVVAFTCNSCPYAVDYEDRLNQLAQKYAAADSAVGVVAINVNKAEKDALPAMIERAREKKFTFPYLYDESQQIARDFGASRTPEFFVLNADRKIVYMGAMDDDATGKDIKQHFVAEAIAAALAGKLPETKETVPIGCNVRYERTRRTKR
ncbi:MAG: thioredoxin family protein [Planctomycetales bacterium]|nr:thioredoxin family protein [Planctomycetales bacterium]